MAAKYGVSIMCSSKERAETMAKLVRADGYGALVVSNTGESKGEYPFLVRRTNRPLKAKTPKRPMLRR